MTATAPLLALLTLAQLSAPDPATLPLRDLERAYLDCERAARTAPLDAGPAMRCSQVYEALKARRFHGDWRGLRDWAEARIAPQPGS